MMYTEERRKHASQAWEDFFHHDKVVPEYLQKYILESWIRCKQLGVPFDYTEVDIPSISNKNLDIELKNKKQLLDIVSPYLYKLFNLVKESECIVALANEDGVILKSISEDNVLKNFPSRSATPGKIFSERMAGTNGIGTAIYLDKPVQIWAAEHYNVQSHLWVCSGSPIHDPQGNIIGCLLISSLADKANIYSLGMVASAVDAIEIQLKLNSYIYKESKQNPELQHALNHVSEGVLITNQSNYIVYSNNYCNELLGAMDIHIIGQSLSSFIENNNEVEQLLQSSKDINPVDITLKTSSKHVKCRLSGMKYFNENHQFQGWILYITPANSVNKLLKQRSNYKAPYTFDNIVGISSSLENAKEYGKIAAGSSSSVLIIGESGTGKEMFAQAIHNHSDRRNGPFIAVNCGAIPPSLIESELFGYCGGAFTGARKEGHAGKFELAEGGTIFLDEIGEMPLDVQVTILRVLQEREFIRVGGTDPIRTNVRVIAATNKDLNAAIEKGEFRLDLYYRLNVFTLQIPPLRDRTDDIEPLADFFLNKYSWKLEKKIYGMESECISVLLNHSWPGNVRELENCIERAVNFADDSILKRKDLNLYDTPRTMEPDRTISKTPSSNYRNRIIELLELHEGNITLVAEDLGIARKTLYAKIKKYDIDVSSYRYR